jgi:hypothetical protein
MKKSTIITLTILIALAGLSIYIYKSKGKTSTIDKEASAFSFKDTASIDKIFLADKDGKQVLLEKKSQGWILDGKYPVRPDILDFITIHH